MMSSGMFYVLVSVAIEKNNFFIPSVKLIYVQISTCIVGLGAGLLPMFLHACLPFLQLEVGTSWAMGYWEKEFMVAYCFPVDEGGGVGSCYVGFGEAIFQLCWGWPNEGCFISLFYVYIYMLNWSHQSFAFAVHFMHTTIAKLIIFKCA